MSAERFVDPELQQALEEVQDALRTERAALAELPSDNAALRERLERLQAERDSLRRELEAFRKGRPGKAPRLPESLTPPFEVRSPGGLLDFRREFVAGLMLMVFVLAWSGKRQALFLISLALIGGALVLLLRAWKGRTWWHFGPGGIEVFGRGSTSAPLPYAEVLDVEVHVSHAQRARGVGTVVVMSKPGSAGTEGKPLLLKSVPEPERLAEWIRSKRSIPLESGPESS